MKRLNEILTIERVVILFLIVAIICMQAYLLFSEINNKHNFLSEVYQFLVVSFDMTPSLSQFRIIKVIVSILFIILAFLLLRSWEKEEKKIERNNWFTVSQGIILFILSVNSLIYFYVVFQSTKIEIEITRPNMSFANRTISDRLVNTYMKQLSQNPRIKNYNYKVVKSDDFFKEDSINNLDNYKDILIVPNVRNKANSDTMVWIQKVFPKDPSLLIQGRNAWKDSVSIVLGDDLPGFIFERPEMLIKFLTAYESSLDGDYYTASIIYRDLIRSLEVKYFEENNSILSKEELKTTISEIYYWLSRLYYRRYLLSNQKEKEILESSIMCLEQALNLNPLDQRFIAYYTLFLKLSINWNEFIKLNRNKENLINIDRQKYITYSNKINSIKKYLTIISEQDQELSAEILYIINDVKKQLENVEE